MLAETAIAESDGYQGLELASLVVGEVGPWKLPRHACFRLKPGCGVDMIGHEREAIFDSYIPKVEVFAAQC